MCPSVREDLLRPRDGSRITPQPSSSHWMIDGQPLEEEGEVESIEKKPTLLLELIHALEVVLQQAATSEMALVLSSLQVVSTCMKK